MTDLSKLIKKVSDFRDARDWKQFHNPKDLAISLTLEASEVIEHFQWKSPEEIEEYIKTNKDDISEELADVFYCLLLISNHLDVDIVDAFEKKMEKNEKKYPVEKAKGNHNKYTEF